MGDRESRALLDRVDENQWYGLWLAAQYSFRRFESQASRLMGAAFTRLDPGDRQQLWQRMMADPVRI